MINIANGYKILSWRVKWSSFRIISLNKPGFKLEIGSKLKCYIQILNIVGHRNMLGNAIHWNVISVIRRPEKEDSHDSINTDPSILIVKCLAEMLFGSSEVFKTVTSHASDFKIIF